jgi:putative flippase GtrA
MTDVQSGRASGELLRFGLAGVAGFAADAAALYLALALGAGPLGGRVVSFLAAVFVTWQINRRITFSSVPATGSLWRQWWRYLGTMLLGGAVNVGVYCLIMLLAPAALASMPPAHSALPLLALACGSLAGMAFNFVGAKLFVFKG